MGYGLEALTYNIKDGYLEGIVRGHKSGLLSASDYNNLCQCETLDDIKLNLTATDYGDYLKDVPSPLSASTIVDRCTQKLVDDWNHMRAHAHEQLGKFLDFCTYGHMIDNVVLIVSGTLHDTNHTELLEKCHPLGLFDSIATLAVATSMRELYRLVLIDTPLAPYFSVNLTSEDLDEMNVEIMRNTLYKAYLDDFAEMCKDFGGGTSEVMGDMLAFEADRRALNITLNSIGTALNFDDRRKLYSDCGLLYPHGHQELSVAADFEQVRAAMEKCPAYAQIFSQMGFDEGQMLDKLMYEEQVRRSMDTFEIQFQYGVFYAYMKLREQEIRNILWIAECVSQDQKSRIQDGIVYIC